MPSTSSHPLEGGPLSDLLRRSALCVLALAVSASLWVRTREFIDIQDYYLLQQDLPLLMAAGIALFLVARTSLAHGTTTTGFNDRAAIVLALAAVAIAYAGSWLVMERYAMSRDEDMADFAARYMQQGLLGLPIPAGVGDLAKASLPLSAGRFIAQGYWVSDYLPMNSALRAAAGLLGDRWLAGPLLLLLGIVATWNAARRLWPMQHDAGIVAVVLAATSTQLVANAMTPYATTAHFALNAVWIACFLRGGRAGHMAAILVGLVAAGLHQFHFHMLFLSGFIAWMWLSHRRRLALLYVAAMIAYYVIWDMVWPQLVLNPMFGTADAGVLTPSQTFLATMVARLSRLTILQPLTSAARFVAWQNVLMLPLAWVGMRGIRREEDGTLPVTFAFAASIGIGLAIMPWQGFGYGYRYLHHLMPCLLLLAAAGTVRRGALNAAPRRGLLIASCAFAIVVTAPFAMWRSHELLASFATAYRMARAAPAEVVVVDPFAGAYVQDIVRIDDPDTRPLLLDLSELDNRQIDTLCATRHVMLFDRRAAIAAGIPGATDEGTPVFASINAKQARMKQLGCTTPIPVTPSHANP